MISEVLWHSPDSNFTENTWDIYCWNEFEIYLFETVVKSPWSQWVKEYSHEYNGSDTMQHFSILYADSFILEVPKDLKKSRRPMWWRFPVH